MQNYKPRNNKFNYILKKASKIGFNQSYYIDNRALITYYYLKKTLFKNNDSKLLIVNLDFEKYVPIIYKDKYQKDKNAFDNILSYWFEDNICYESKLKDEIDTGKTIFILFDCPNYGYNWDKTYVTHSTCAIIHKKQCYYINPHGDLVGDEVCKWYKWNEKTQEVNYYQFDQTVDRMVISCLMEELNINYSVGPTNTYCGLALQSFDNYGCCFIFPVAIWFEFETNFEKYIDLLERGLLISVIEHIFIKNTNINSHNILPGIIQLTISNKNLTEYINKEKHRLVKDTLNRYIGFMSQKKIQEKINY